MVGAVGGTTDTLDNILIPCPVAIIHHEERGTMQWNLDVNLLASWVAFGDSPFVVVFLVG